MTVSPRRLALGWRRGSSDCLLRPGLAGPPRASFCAAAGGPAGAAAVEVLATSTPNHAAQQFWATGSGGGNSRRRDRHSATPPLHFVGVFNSNGEGVSVK